MHVIADKAVAFKQAMAPVYWLSEADCEQCKGLGGKVIGSWSGIG